jgi:aryl-alcohol dehydrogenase-like predicted oxidoreductase
MPMAQELGLGVTPWSPLRGGALSGKYTRESAGAANPDRGQRVTAYLNERTFTIVDELVRIARELDTTPAAVAVAWVQSKPGVTSTIVGARRLDQLHANLEAVNLTLAASQIADLDRVSEPTLSFPASFLHTASSFMHAGATVNGKTSEVLPLWRDAAAKRY